MSFDRADALERRVTALRLALEEIRDAVDTGDVEYYALLADKALMTDGDLEEAQT
jgi:hypothetical protein